MATQLDTKHVVLRSSYYNLDDRMEPGEKMLWPGDLRDIGLENMKATEIWFLMHDFNAGRYTPGKLRLGRSGRLVVGIVHIDDGPSYEFKAGRREYGFCHNTSIINWITKLEEWDERAKQ